MNKLNPKLIIFIIGTTASGKTKLSIELSKKFNCEIIRFNKLKKAQILCSFIKMQI
jgi:hypothetical protein